MNGKDGSMVGWMIECVNGWMCEWIFEWIDGLNEWMDVWMDGWKYGMNR
jgi:hypothetical protein